MTFDEAETHVRRGGLRYQYLRRVVASGMFQTSVNTDYLEHLRPPKLLNMKQKPAVDDNAEVSSSQ